MDYVFLASLMSYLSLQRQELVRSLPMTSFIKELDVMDILEAITTPLLVYLIMFKQN
jgi:hypothetical protein